jgi:hypothetical protein
MKLKVQIFLQPTFFWMLSFDPRKKNEDGNCQVKMVDLKNMKTVYMVQSYGITWCNKYLELFKYFSNMFSFFNTILQILFSQKYILASHTIKSKGVIFSSNQLYVLGYHNMEIIVKIILNSTLLKFFNAPPKKWL